MNEKERTSQVAEIILAQLGGWGRLEAMIGMKNVFYLRPADNKDQGPALQFQFKGSRKANWCKITLSPSDTYVMEIVKVNYRTGGFEPVYEQDGLYADMLKPVIEEVTGLRLSL